MRRFLFATNKYIGLLLAFLFIGQPVLAAFDPNDIYYPRQWYLPQIGAPLAWEKTTGSPDVVIAVIDTGVDTDHPDLRNNIWRNPSEIENDGIDNDKNGFIDDTHGWDFIDHTNDPRPSAVPPFSITALNHGTIVSGIIAAAGNNVEGIAGIAWRSRIMPLRVLDQRGQGDVSNVANAVDYAVKNGADIINLSFVGVGYSQALYNSLRRAYDSGVLIIVAAGNSISFVDGDLEKTPRYPVCFDAKDKENWIVGVTATDTLDQRLNTANYGGDCVDIAAPGTMFFGAQVFDLKKGLSEPYGGSWSGTSVAAPVVSGVAALIMASDSTLTNKQIIKILLNSADPINFGNFDLASKLGKGRVNVSRALLGAATPSATAPIESTISGGRLITVSNSPDLPSLNIFSGSGEKIKSWNVYGKTFKAGGGIAVSENARRVPETKGVGITALIRGEQTVVVGEGRGGSGWIRLYDTTGLALAQWYAYDAPFSGGINVAAGDIYGVGKSNIVVAPFSGGGPNIRVFDKGGKLQAQFFAYDKNIRGGFSVAVSDVNKDGMDEIIVSSTTLSLPVRIFRVDGQMLKEWWPYPNYRGGVNIAAGDFDMDAKGEIAVVPVAGGGPNLRIFDIEGHSLGQFFVFNQTFRGGVNLAVGDINSDGRDEIAVTPLSRGGPQARFFDGNGRLIGQFFSYDSKYRGGVQMAVLR